MNTNDTLIVSDETGVAAGRLRGWDAVAMAPPDIAAPLTAAAVGRAIGTIAAAVTGCENSSEHQSSQLHHFCEEVIDLDIRLGRRFNGVIP